MKKQNCYFTMGFQIFEKTRFCWDFAMEFKMIHDLFI